MTSAAAEGWAHYIGSRLTDLVYDREGEKLWPEAYDYRQDGMARLRKQLGSSKGPGSQDGAGVWMSLGKLSAANKGFAALFSAWAQAKVDEANPGNTLRPALLTCGDRDRLDPWWTKRNLFWFRKSRQQFRTAPGRKAGVARSPQELTRDDGASAGQRSIAGSAHAVRFEAPGTNCYLTSVRVFGSRYGHPHTARRECLRLVCAIPTLSALRVFHFLTLVSSAACRTG